MQYLGLALYAEGPTDHDFLCPLLLRLCEDLCGRSRHEVLFHGVLSLNGREGPAASVPEGLSRAERIFALANATREEWTVLFVHADGGGKAARKKDRARAEQVRPALDLVERASALEGRKGCAVVPVQEMEAWALADPDALRGVVGRAGAAPVTGVPFRAAGVERIDQPKERLRKVIDELRRPGSRHRRSSSGESMLSDLGKIVSLDRLREVPAFSELEKELTDALVLLRLLE